MRCQHSQKEARIYVGTCPCPLCSLDKLKRGQLQRTASLSDKATSHAAYKHVRTFMHTQKQAGTSTSGRAPALLKNGGLQGVGLHAHTHTHTHAGASAPGRAPALPENGGLQRLGCDRAEQPKPRAPRARRPADAPRGGSPPYGNAPGATHGPGAWRRERSQAHADNKKGRDGHGPHCDRRTGRARRQ